MDVEASADSFCSWIARRLQCLLRNINVYEVVLFWSSHIGIDLWWLFKFPSTISFQNWEDNWDKDSVFLLPA